MVYTNHELTAQLQAAEERMAQLETQLANVTTALAVALEALERPQSAAKVRRLVKRGLQEAYEIEQGAML